ASSVHLLVACHGLWGQPIHLNYMMKKLAEDKGGEISPLGVDPDKTTAAATSSSSTSTATASAQPQLVILMSKTNMDARTYDGVDWCAERTVQEIEREVRRLRKKGRKIVRFSILGYSLGGLMARYIVGLLYSRGWFKDVEPYSFTTLATPHIGMPMASGWFYRVAGVVGPRLLGRTGRQLYAKDKGWDTSDEGDDTPLLLAMTRPDSSFIKGLQLFKHLDIYASATSDTTVPVKTGGLMSVDPWKGWPEGGDEDVDGRGITIERDPKYPALVTAINIPSHRPKKPNPATRIYRAVVPRQLPFLLKPSALPFPFPLNWVYVLLAPVSIPLFFTLIIVRLAKGSQESDRRVKEIEAEWLKGDHAKAISSELEADGYTKQHERSRIVAVLAEKLREADEDYVSVEGGTSLPNGASHPAPSKDHKDAAGNVKRSATSPLHFVIPSEESEAYLSSKQAPLSPIHQEMQNNLHGNLPRMRKHLAFFEGVRNSHAIIVCRTPSMPVHQMGKPVVQHFVDHF
ncbi:DUF676-domain-containing protein, partial [Jaminaea rosea]